MPSATVSDSTPIETAHEDIIHDAQLDYYGKRLATCSSDRTVKVFDVVDTSSTGGAGAGGGSGGTEVVGKGVTLKGHTGPVWQVAWAHPKFGQILASCSYDGKVIIWKEQTGQGGGWTKIKEHSLHTASVNSVSWAPHELGAILACASSDGKLSVLEFKNDGQWGAELFNGHAIGCNAVSWAPAFPPGSLIFPQAPSAPGAPSSTQPVRRFASAGCDNLVRIWAYRNTASLPNPPNPSQPGAGQVLGGEGWIEEDVLDGHTDWVRDVAWAPNVGLNRSYIATASQDRTVCVWIKDASPNGTSTPWTKTVLDPSGLTSPTNATTGATNAAGGKFPDVVWRVSWSLAGNLLAVSCGDGKVSLWKENLRGIWECVSDVNS